MEAMFGPQSWSIDENNCISPDESVLIRENSLKYIKLMKGDDCEIIGGSWRDQSSEEKTNFKDPSLVTPAHVVPISIVEESGGKHWSDEDKDCQRARDEAMIRDVLDEATLTFKEEKSGKLCRVDEGLDTG